MIGSRLPLRPCFLFPLFISKGDGGPVSGFVSHLLGEFEFSEGTSEKLIFDVEIVKLKTQKEMVLRRSKSCFGRCWNRLVARSWLSPKPAVFIFHFFWQNARWTLKPFYLDQIKLFNKSKSTLTYYFFNAVLLLTRNQAVFYRLCIKFWHFIHFLAPRRGLFARCLAGWNFLLGIFFFWAAALKVPLIGQNHAWLMLKVLSRAVECTNYKPKKAGPGHNF